MKRAIILLLATLGMSVDTALAQGCQTYCTDAWMACKSVCKSGEEGHRCKSQCAEEHENCMNGCKKQTGLDIQRNPVVDHSIEKYLLRTRPLLAER